MAYREISRLWANHDFLDKARFALGGAEIEIPELPKEKPSWTDKKKGKAPDHPKEEETSDGKSVVPGATLPTIPIIRSSASISCGPAFLGLVAGCSLVSTLVSSAAFASASPSSDSSPETTPVSSPLATNAVPPVVTAGRENPPPSSTLTTSAVVSTSTTQTSNEVERPTTTKAAKPGRPAKLCVSRPPSSDKDAVPWTWNVPSSGLVRQWNQCGGQDWNGGNTCEKPYICKYFSNWYSQCE
ncbi:uncharacterized protein RAG0_06730 [Rhynchosporium agropyri]|uniref:CBM1 domain-containing protein n=1 Tax=Rhynchosporium agropyri TaxID=914238 RepID=A0A1E1KIG8_9HELO|nr:uncharacterized protein RAG0_06730 [Rhynchosporium agropyri]